MKYANKQTNKPTNQQRKNVSTKVFPNERESAYNHIGRKSMRGEAHKPEDMRENSLCPDLLGNQQLD